MPEATQYSFTYREVLEALIRKADLHEGRWQLTMTFGLAGINAGPSPETMVPGAVVGVQSIGLTRATDVSPPALVIDAAEVDPAST